MGGVRAFGREDTEVVAGLFMRLFRHGRRDPPPELAAYLAAIFLDHPWRDPDLESLVYVAPDGVVRGFIGLLPLRMRLGGRQLRAAVGSSLMVDGAAGDPLAGARLMRAFLQGPQDLTLGEATADVTRRMWMTLGGRTLPQRSLAWTRILRPAGFAADIAARRVPAIGALRVLAGPLDRMLGRWRGGAGEVAAYGAPVAPQARGTDVAPEDLAAVIPGALQRYTLRPDFELPVLRWLLSHAARKELRGAPVARVVMGRLGRPVGGWLGHLRPRGVLQVMQVFAPPSEAEAVLDDILAEGIRAGAVAVSGPAQPELMDALQLRGCFFRHAGFSLVHARDAAVMEALQRSDAFFGGIAGEVWIRLSGSDLA
jgi:hypothetical protein